MALDSLVVAIILTTAVWVKFFWYLFIAVPTTTTATANLHILFESCNLKIYTP